MNLINKKSLLHNILHATEPYKHSNLKFKL